MSKSVFISYSESQQDWVRQELVPVLEAGGADVLIDYREFKSSRLMVDKQSGTWPSSGSNGTVYLTTNGVDSAAMFIDRDTNVDELLEPSYPIDVVGIAGQFDNSFPRLDGFQIIPRDSTDITGASPPVVLSFPFTEDMHIFIQEISGSASSEQSKQQRNEN